MTRIDPQSDSYSALMWDVITNAHYYTPRPGDHVLDLGANKGMFSLFCAARGCHVVAYEPFPDSHAELLHTVDVAKEIGQGTIQAVRMGVSNDGGPRRMSLCPDTSGSHSIVKQFEDNVAIPTITLDRAVNDVHWDCLKVDIEGAELEVFESFTRWANIRFLTMEVHNDILSIDEVVRLAGMLREHFNVMVPLRLKSNPETVVSWYCWSPK